MCCFRSWLTNFTTQQRPSPRRKTTILTPSSYFNNTIMMLLPQTVPCCATTTSSSFRRRGAIGMMILLLPLFSLSTLTPLIRSLSINWNLPTTTTTTTTTTSTAALSSTTHNDKNNRASRVETIFLEGNEHLFEANNRPIRTMIRYNIPDFTDVTQYYSDTDSEDTEMERRIFPHHDYDDHCVPMAPWQSTFYPTCNDFHGMDALSSLRDQELWMLSLKGFWRFAWEVVENRTASFQQEQEHHHRDYKHDGSYVLRTFKLEHDYEEQYFENNRVDAIAMERLTKSPFVINMYGFCGMSVTTEFAGQRVAEVVDKVSWLKKLELAQMISQGVDDVHSIDGGDGDDHQISLVHNDLNFGNILIGKNHSRPLINDFNIAVLLMKHNETGEPCQFTSHYPNPQWRAPEEQVDENGRTSQHLSEKIDIYALGNVMYRFAVGHSPWKKANGRSLTSDEKRQVALLKLTEGKLPDVPNEVLHSNNPATQGLLQIMRECYHHDPTQRPTAKQIVNELQVIINDYKEDLDKAKELRKLQAKRHYYKSRHNETQQQQQHDDEYARVQSF